MATYERRPQKVLDWLAAGNDIYALEAGLVRASLKAREVDADVSVKSDGTIEVVTDASHQKVYPALDAIDPATLDTRAARRAELLAELAAILAEIRAKPVLARTPAERALLVQAALLEIDGGSDTAPGAPASAKGKP